MGTVWSGNSGWQGAFAALAFVTINTHISVPGVSVGDNELAFLYFSYTAQTNAGFATNYSAPTLRDGSGNVRGVATIGGSFLGNSFYCDLNWGDVAGGGGSIDASYETTEGNYMACLQALIMVGNVFTPTGLTPVSNSGGGSGASLTMNRPVQDFMQAALVASNVAANPSVSSGDWAGQQSNSRAFGTIYGTLTGGCGLATYDGDVGALTTNASWNIGGSGSWATYSFLPTGFAAVEGEGVMSFGLGDGLNNPFNMTFGLGSGAVPSTQVSNPYSVIIG